VLGRAAAVLAALKPPEAGSIVVKAKRPKLRAAALALALQQRLAAFKAHKRARLEELEAMLAGRQTKLAALELSLSQEILILEELGAAAQSPQGKEPPIPLLESSKITADLQRWSTARDELDEESTDLPRRRLELARELENTEEEQAALRKSGERIAEHFQDELRWDGFIQTVASQSNAALRGSFVKAEQEVREGIAAVSRSRTIMARSLSALGEAKGKLGKVEDPLLRREKENAPGERERILASLRAAAGLPANLEVAPKTTPLPEPSKPADRLASLLAEEVLLDQQLRSQAQRREILTLFRSAEERLAGSQRSLSEALQSAISAARRAYGCAEELLLRLGDGRLQGTELPAEATRAGDRTRLITLKRELREAEMTAAKDRESSEAQIAEKTAFIEPYLRKRRSQVETELGLLRERQHVLTAAATPMAKLSNYERKIIEEHAREVRAKEETITEILLVGLLKAKQTADLVQRVDEIYQQLADIERREHAVKQAQAHARNSLELMDKRRALVTEFLPQLRAYESAVAAASELAELRARAAVDLVHRDELLDSIARRFGKEAALPEGLPKGTNDQDHRNLSEQIYRLRMQVRALLAWRSRLQDETGAAGNALISSYEKEISADEARMVVLAAERSRIRGISPGKPGAEARIPELGWQEGRMAQGELRLTLARLRRDGLRAIRRAVLSLVLIPLIAWIILVISRRAMTRILWRFEPHPDADKQSFDEDTLTLDDDDQRLKTLINVFGTAWKSVVVVVAGIYLLKQLGADVTPILASAGVAGLALVFGAQSLVRDFFTGFFILLENQYKIGDYVNIGDVGGTVEDITLRVTLLRDPQGNLHFIPNGQIEQVTNYTHGWSGIYVDAFVGYGENLDLVIEKLHELSHRIYQEPRWRVDFHEKPEVRGVEELGDSGITVRVVLRTKPGRQWALAREFRKRMKAAFDLAGIEIPFPQRVVQVLQPNPAAATSPGLGVGSSPEDIESTESRLAPEAPMPLESEPLAPGEQPEET